MKMRIHCVTQSTKSRFQQGFTIWSRRRVDLHLWKRRQLLVMRMIDPPLSYDKILFKCVLAWFIYIYITITFDVTIASCCVVVWIYFRMSFNFLAVHYFILNSQNGCVTDAKRTKLDHNFGRVVET